ncbi:MAG: ZIP family zinc transporter [Crocinitomicaceae bacterium]|nr:ZIP family zinc transporter [Crocinitomicaceae bacterium]
MPMWFEAALWGFLAGGALLIGAFFGYFLSLPKWVISAVMAFGSGVLVSAMSFELLVPAYQDSGLLPAAFGFMLGALLYSCSNYLLSIQGAGNRKKSSGQQTEDNKQGSGTAIAMGAALDGVPESIAIGLTLVNGSVSLAAVIAIFISNIPEGISSSAGMKVAGRKPMYIFGIWLSIAIISGLSAALGYSMCNQIPLYMQSGIVACAGGAILTMLADTMIPEAYEGTGNWTGVIMCVGFLLAFGLSTMEF